MLQLRSTPRIHRHTLACSWVALAFAVTSACSDGGGETGSTAAKTDSGGTDGGGIVFGDSGGGGVDVAADGAVNLDATADAAADTAADVVDPGNGCDFPAAPQDGEAGASCVDNTDCDSGFCAKTADGGRCTRTCTECCPTGWGCQQAPGNDAVYVCLPRLEALCLPCSDDAACEARNPGALCVRYDDGAAHFCGGVCKIAADCPAGYDCADAKGTSGAAKQCVLKTGLCACGTVAIAEGLASLCELKNASGLCAGARTCSADGLAACDAPVPADESCNGKDDDCDGDTDEGVGVVACESKNDHGVCKGSATCSAGAAICDAAVPAAEACNGVDDDCDGATDEGCDDDKDGYCAIGVAIKDLPPSCETEAGCSGAMPPWCSKGIGDCDDADKAIYPSAAETCGNSKDDDCDGKTDAAAADKSPVGCSAFYADGDKDGFGDAKNKACLCAASVGFPVADATDCDDGDLNIKPGAKEICANGKDDDCDGDENQKDAQGCSNYYVDLDGDGYGTGAATCLCAAKDDLKALAGGDCDDKVKAVYPTAKEVCNGKDDNCEGTTDEEGAEGCKAWFVDTDKDGWGDAAKSACLCGASGLYVTLQVGDCNDGNPVVHKGMAELCYDNIDNDCDSDTDEEDGKGCIDFYYDGDKDGYGDNSKKKCLCDKGAAAGYTASKGTDCDDTTGAISPDVKEICDGKDNDCDGNTDGGCDKDGDGYCDESKTTVGNPPACPKGGGDCNDDPNSGGSGIYPGAVEICNGKDDNCAAGNDEGCDVDNDGYCSKAKIVVGNPSVCAKGGGDCNDGDKAINPGATEICNDKDDNCSAGIDEGCDDDNDGYCDKAMTIVGKPKTCLSGGGDCCDLDNSTKPGQTGWFTSANQCAGFDYNCSGSAEQENTVLAKPKHICEGFLCLDKAECVADPKGWETSAPACGKSGTWVDDYQWNGSLQVPLVNTCKTSVTSQKTQRCH